MVKRWNDVECNRRTLKIEIKENYASSSTLIETKNERERERILIFATLLELKTKKLNRIYRTNGVRAKRIWRNMLEGLEICW